MNQNGGFYDFEDCVVILWAELRVVLGFYAPFNSIFLPKFRDDLTAWLLKMGPVVWPETSVQTTVLRCVKYQKSADLIYAAAESWNHVLLVVTPCIKAVAAQALSQGGEGVFVFSR